MPIPSNQQMVQELERSRFLQKCDEEAVFRIMDYVTSTASICKRTNFDTDDVFISTTTLNLLSEAYKEYRKLRNQKDSSLEKMMMHIDDMGHINNDYKSMINFDILNSKMMDLSRTEADQHIAVITVDGIKIFPKK